MLMYVEPYNKLIASQVGTGDNLDEQDIEDGYVDYWLSSVYEQVGEEITLEDSGQILTSTPIEDMDRGDDDMYGYIHPDEDMPEVGEEMTDGDGDVWLRTY